MIRTGNSLRACVFGASGGIGKALCEKLVVSDHVAHVYAGARRPILICWVASTAMRLFVSDIKMLVARTSRASQAIPRAVNEARATWATIAINAADETGFVWNQPAICNLLRLQIRKAPPTLNMAKRADQSFMHGGSGGLVHRLENPLAEPMAR